MSRRDEERTKSAPSWPPKSEWGPGPWQDEPDELQWEYRGLRCAIWRNPEMGNLCGYAEVPVGHPWHGTQPDGEDGPDAHGGITYGGERFDDGAWFIGFDCGHAMDAWPGMDAWRRSQGRIYGIPGAVYRALPYVKAEAEQLADQVLAGAQ